VEQRGESSEVKRRREQNMEPREREAERLKDNTNMTVLCSGNISPF
jgi:hypothetical protein